MDLENKREERYKYVIHKAIHKISDEWIEKNIEYKYFNKNLIFTKSKINKLFKLLNKHNKNDIDEITKNAIILSNIPYNTREYIKYKYKNLSPVNITSTFNNGYIILNNNNNIIVTISGTKNFTNIRSNLRIIRYKFHKSEYFKKFDIDKYNLWRTNFIKQQIFKNNIHDIHTIFKNKFAIHRGFYNRAIFILIPLIKQINNIIKKNKKTNNKYNILFVGHSLGGALSDICSTILKINPQLIKKEININCITLSAPALGNKNYNLLKLYTNLNYYQIYNNLDLLAKIKIGHKLIRRYRHTRTLLKKSKNHYKIHLNNFHDINYNKYLMTKLKGLSYNKIKVYHSFYVLPGIKKLFII